VQASASSQVKPISAIPQVVIIALASFVMTLVTMARTALIAPGTSLFSNPWDHHKYMEMARNGPWAFHLAPFCWRILAPLMAMVMPLDIVTNFKIITVCGLALSGVTVFYITLETGFPKPAAILAMLLFFSSITVKFDLAFFCGPNALALCLMSVCFLLILKKKDLLFAAALAAGALTKEPVLLMIVLFYSLRAVKFFDLRQLQRTVWVALPAAIAFIAVRLWIPALNDNAAYVASLSENLRVVMKGQPSFSYAEAVWVMIRELRATNGVVALELFTVAPFGLLFFLVPFGIANHWVYCLRIAPFMAIIYMQSLFSASIAASHALGWIPVMLVALFVIQDTGISYRDFWPAALLLWAANLIRVGGVEAPFLVQAVIATLAIAVSIQISGRLGRSHRPGVLY
jgi:hypothetical protein